MSNVIVRDQAKKYLKNRPEIRPGYTVRVHERIQEGNKERIQVFEGLVIALHKGQSPTDSSFTVRRLFSGVGVEKVFPLHSPKIEKIEVKKVAKVRRAKLYFLRALRGKAARLQERFTTAAEFLVDDEPDPAQDEVMEEVEESEKEEVRSEKNEEDAKDAGDAKVTNAKEDETKEDSSEEIATEDEESDKN